MPEFTGPTVVIKWINMDDFGRLLRISTLSVSIDGSAFVPIGTIMDQAKIMDANLIARLDTRENNAPTLAQI